MLGIWLVGFGFFLFLFFCWEKLQQILYCNHCSLRNQIKRIIYLCTDSFSTQGSNTFDIKFIFFYYTRLTKKIQIRKTEGKILTEPHTLDLQKQISLILIQDFQYKDGKQNIEKERKNLNLPKRKVLQKPGSNNVRVPPLQICENTTKEITKKLPLFCHPLFFVHLSLFLPSLPLLTLSRWRKHKP